METFRPLSVPSWREDVYSILESMWGSWEKTGPVILKIFRTILDHLNTARARKIILQHEDRADLYIFAYLINEVGTLRYELIQSPADRKGEKDIYNNENLNAEAKADRAAKLLDAFEDAERDIKRDISWLYNRDDMKAWRHGWEAVLFYYRTIAEFNPLAPPRRTRKSVMEYLDMQIRENLNITGMDRLDIIAFLVSAALLEEIDAKRVSVELSPSRSKQ